MIETTNMYAPQFRGCAVRVVLDHEQDHASRRAEVVSIAAKVGCMAQLLHECVKKAEIDRNARAGVPTQVSSKLTSAERENSKLRQANEILRTGSAYFARAERANDLWRPFKQKHDIVMPSPL